MQYKLQALNLLFSVWQEWAASQHGFHGYVMLRKHQTAHESSLSKIKNQYLFFALFTVVCVASFQNLSSNKLIQWYFQALTWSHTQVESHEGFLTLIPKFKKKNRLELTQPAGTRYMFRKEYCICSTAIKAVMLTGAFIYFPVLLWPTYFNSSG